MTEITREKIVEIARELLGVPYLHQGRNPATGLDCVGLGAVIAARLGYPIIDLTSYKRLPDSETVRSYLAMNLDEIALEEVGIGDVYFMRVSQEPTHFAIKASDVYAPEKGIVPTLIHALSSPTVNAIVEQPVRLWRSKLVSGFRFRGIK